MDEEEGGDEDEGRENERNRRLKRSRGLWREILSLIPLDCEITFP